MARSPGDHQLLMGVTDRASLAEMGNEEETGRRHWSRGTYSLPEELAGHAPRKRFAPDELRVACRESRHIRRVG